MGQKLWLLVLFRRSSRRALRRFARAFKATPRLLGVALFGALLVAAVTFTAQAPPWMWEPYAETLGRLEALIKVATPLVILIGLYIAWRRSTAHDLQARTAEQGQITERFTKAVEQLADERLAVRLGGIYALERIAADSHDRDHRVVFEVLCAFVREQRTPQKGGGNLGELLQDVQAVLSVIRRRERFPEEEIIDLHGADLREAHLHRAHLKGAILHRAHLERTNLSEANLSEANLRGASLGGANLCLANLGKADLNGADLGGAFLLEANLSGANLGGAYLGGAILGGAHLKGAFLVGADLSEAQNLQPHQLAAAIGEKKTQLPKGCSRPDHWLSFFPQDEEEIPSSPPESPENP